MNRLRTWTASLALAGHCFAIVGAYALHGPHLHECCPTAVHDEDGHCSHHHHNGTCVAEDNPDNRGSQDRHDEENCGWCRFLALAGTEPQVVEPPAGGDAVVSPVCPSHPIHARTAPARPSVRGPPC